MAPHPTLTTPTRRPPNLMLEGFKALSDPLRLQVIELLQQQELCVCDLCDRLGVAQSKLSFHLKILKTAQILAARQQGKWVYYSLNSDQLHALQQFLRSLSSTHPPAAVLCSEDAPALSSPSAEAESWPQI